MPDAIERLRAEAEADLTKLMRRVNAGQRERLLAAIDTYGSVRAIPEDFWRGIEQELDAEAAAVLLLLLAGTYQSNLDRIGKRSTAEAREKLRLIPLDRNTMDNAIASPAAELGRKAARDYAAALRKRLESRIDNRAEEINRLPAEEAGREITIAVDDAVDDDLADAVSSTTVTQTITIGQDSAASDFTTATGLVTDVVWKTERDSRVCPICKPLDGKKSVDWERVATEAGNTAETVRYVLDGPPAHPRCRCRLEHYPAPSAN